jgi:catechol 2,3-dioxygenase-like lactoylglutathione lyase family enzyme
MASTVISSRRIDSHRCICQSHSSTDINISVSEVAVSRVQLALNVSDVDAAVAFYSKLFDTLPAKRRPGYANFAVDSPPLKLVLIENPEAAGTLNHLGVEVATSQDVAAATGRLQEEGLEAAIEENVTCCYAVQDKVWVSDPDQAAGEIYTVLADADRLSPTVAAGEAGGCCGSPAHTDAPADASTATAGCC